MMLETFSYLPEMSAAQLTEQVRSILSRHLMVGIEYTARPDPYGHYWTMWKLPLFGTAEPDAVLAEVESCRQAHPEAYIKINSYDRARQGQVVSFVAVKPERGT